MKNRTLAALILMAAEEGRTPQMAKAMAVAALRELGEDPDAQVFEAKDGVTRLEMTGNDDLMKHIVDSPADGKGYAS